MLYGNDIHPLDEEQMERRAESLGDLFCPHCEHGFDHDHPTRVTSEHTGREYCHPECRDEDEREHFAYLEWKAART